MTIESLLSYIGAFGIGGLIGILLKSIFEFRLANRKLLFDARTKAYAGITGRLANHFCEPDIMGLRDYALIVARINGLLSELQLLGSKELITLVDAYQEKLTLYHSILGEKGHEEEADSLHKD